VNVIVLVEYARIRSPTTISAIDLRVFDSICTVSGPAKQEAEDDDEDGELPGGGAAGEGLEGVPAGAGAGFGGGTGAVLGAVAEAGAEVGNCPGT